MAQKHNRVKARTAIDNFLKLVHDYAYAETLIIVAVYLGIGYLMDPKDICMLNSDISYILILLAIITLFHGFENGMLTVAILALFMWLFYDVFAYIEFLVALLMTMIFSEFHYYWTGKINDAEIEANYRGSKLDELSKAFYTLKISHDQLEKNYVVKPMSIRNSIELIINNNEKIKKDETIDDKTREYYTNFLSLLAKSFNVQSSIIIYKDNDSNSELFNAKTTNVVFGAYTETIDMKDLFRDYLIDEAVNRKTAIYISDKMGEPTTVTDRNSDFLCVLPALQENKLVSILIIKKMPFMSFNRENLTSVSILLDYFAIEVRNRNLLYLTDEMAIVKDIMFRFEYARLKNLYKKYNTESMILVLKTESELQSIQVYEKIEKMLRSLDMVTKIKEKRNYFILIMFPLHDKAAAEGFHKRLVSTMKEDRDKNMESATFSMSQTGLINKYLREDYGE
jgi:cell division protein ZapA (FtsZ GTPase activity inhibitor)